VPAGTVAPSGSFEFRAHSLLALGRHVDAAFAAYQPAREALEEAWRRWQEAIAQLPAGPPVNGELDEAAANGC
jgi:leucyl aminopeptidase